jgi:signal transduction histidine kinase
MPPMGFFLRKRSRQTAQRASARFRIPFCVFSILVFGALNQRAENLNPPEAGENFEIRYLKAGDREKINILEKLGAYWLVPSPGKSIEYLKEALPLSRKLNDKEVEANLLYQIGDLYDGLRNDSQALEYYQQALKTFSLMHVENKEQEKKSKTFNFIVVGVFFLALAALLFRYYYQHRVFKNELKRSAERQKNLEFESQLKTFQSKVNPHFLYNALDSLGGLSADKNGSALRDVITRLADLYRGVFTATEIQTHTLANELVIIRDYLEIEKMILYDRLDYHIQVSEKLLDFKIMPLLILPLIENAVIHGIKKKREGGCIRIDIAQEDHSINIRIMDNGLGFNPADIRSGFGLYSVQERLKLFYERKARFCIDSSRGSGTTIRLEVPDA